MGVKITVTLIFLALLGFIFYISQSSGFKTSKSLLSPTPDISQIPSLVPIIKSQVNGLDQSTPDPKVQAQQQQLQQALNEIKAASIAATIKTAKGDITLELYGKDAPITVFNFVQKAKTGFYDNKVFHRVEDWVIQGGDPNGDGTGGGNLPVEFNQRPFVEGSLGQASRGDNQVQNDSQFFITKSEASWLNGKYTNYGTVTSGMDVVQQIAIGDKIQHITITQTTQ